MGFNDTLNRFKLVTGLDDSETARWIPLINDAREYVYSLSVKESLSDFDKKRLDNAAGINAYYRYSVYTSEDESSFSAGDISITANKDKVKNAKEIWDRELENICDIVSASGFSFKAVM